MINEPRSSFEYFSNQNLGDEHLQCVRKMRMESILVNQFQVVQGSRHTPMLLHYSFD
jgi:hypothetical protein